MLSDFTVGNYYPWTAKDKKSLMYSGAHAAIYKDSSKIRDSGKRPENGVIVVTTLDTNTGKVTWKIQGGETLAEETDERLKSGVWFFAVNLWNPGAHSKTELIDE